MKISSRNRRVGKQVVYYQTPGSLCEDFVDQSRKTWDRLRVSKLAGISISEESITDFNLLDLQIKHPYEIRTQKFNKRREAKVGADWEWWLGSRNLWLGVRCQAKKIDSANLNYPCIDERNQYGRQIDLLIANSLKHKPPIVPVFIFYNYWDVSRFDPHWLCLTYPKSLEMLGCSISHAVSIKPLLDQGHDGLRDIERIMYPWSCLVCCTGFSQGNSTLPFRAFDFLYNILEKYVGKQIASDFGADKRGEFISQAPPIYVYKILEGELLSEEDWHGINVDRITVIHEEVHEIHST